MWSQATDSKPGDRREGLTCDQKSHAFILDLLLCQLLPCFRILGFGQVLEHIRPFHSLSLSNPLLHHRVRRRHESPSCQRVWHKGNEVELAFDGPDHLPADVHVFADTADRFQRRFIHVAGQRLKGCAIADIADDVMAEVSGPVGHVSRGGPPNNHRGHGDRVIGCFVHEPAAENLDFGGNVLSRTLQRAIGESLGRMFVSCEQRHGDQGYRSCWWTRCCTCNSRPSWYGLWFPKSDGRRYRCEVEIVGAYSNDRSIQLVELAEAQILPAGLSVVDGVCTGDACVERSGIIGNWVE